MAPRRPCGRPIGLYCGRAAAGPAAAAAGIIGDGAGVLMALSISGVKPVAMAVGSAAEKKEHSAPRLPFVRPA